jgi:hypothetical protein
MAATAGPRCRGSRAVSARRSPMVRLSIQQCAQVLLLRLQQFGLLTSVHQLRAGPCGEFERGDIGGGRPVVVPAQGQDRDVIVLTGPVVIAGRLCTNVHRDTECPGPVEWAVVLRGRHGLNDVDGRRSLFQPPRQPVAGVRNDAPSPLHA